MPGNRRFSAGNQRFPAVRPFKPVMNPTKPALGGYRRTMARKAVRPLRNSRGFEAFVLDQFAGLGDVTAKPMFGGLGLYCGDRFFAIVARDVLYLKVDDETRPSFARLGSRPFTPYADRPGTMQYYEVPISILEDTDDLLRRARGAVAAAERARAAPAKRVKRTLIK